MSGLAFISQAYSFDSDLEDGEGDDDGKIREENKVIRKDKKKIMEQFLVLPPSQVETIDPTSHWDLEDDFAADKSVKLANKDLRAELREDDEGDIAGRGDLGTRNKTKTLYRCPFCFAIFPTGDHFIRHLPDHKHQNAEKLQRHHVSASNAKEKRKKRITRKYRTKKYSCDKCNATFGISSNLARHWNKIHLHDDDRGKELANPVPAKSSVVTPCKVVLTRCDPQVRSFMATQGTTEPDSKTNDHNSGYQNLKASGSFKCSLLSNKFSTSSQIPSRSRSRWRSIQIDPEIAPDRFRTGGKCNKCHTCGKSFRDARDLKRHIITHSTERQRLHKCSTCSKRFGRSDILKQHVATHSEARNYKCSTCPLSFKNSNGLKRHEMTHSDEHRHKCPSCPKSFRRGDTLKTHVLTHTLVKKYKCPTCSTGFARSDTLKVHMAVHTGVRNYKCSHCTRQFYFPFQMKAHIVKAHQ